MGLEGKRLVWFFFLKQCFFHIIIRGLLLFLEAKGCGRWLPLAVKGWRSGLGLSRGKTLLWALLWWLAPLW